MRNNSIIAREKKQIQIMNYIGNKARQIKNLLDNNLNCRENGIDSSLLDLDNVMVNLFNTTFNENLKAHFNVDIKKQDEIDWNITEAVARDIQANKSIGLKVCVNKDLRTIDFSSQALNKMYKEYLQIIVKVKN